MDITELNRDQIRAMKFAYMCELADEGTFAEVMGVDYDAPSWMDEIQADDLVTDELIFDHYAGVSFTEEDFCIA